MKIFSHSSRGSALLISLIILVLVTITTTVFLERIWGSFTNVQGIESSNAAYYQAVGIIEQQLITPGVTKRTPWVIQPVPKPTTTSTGRYLSVLTGGTVMPSPGTGNSPYNSDYNIIALGQPVQIVIPNGIIWGDVDFQFKVPAVGSGSTTVDTFMNSSGIILWTLGYTGASLYASGETNIFQGSHIDNGPESIEGFDGITNSGTLITFLSFYTDANYLGVNGSNCTNYACTLKLSMIRPVKTTDNIVLPFLEYKLSFTQSGPVVSVPSQFMTLDAYAYSYGFQRSTTLRIPQITTNTALDFAVLQ